MKKIFLLIILLLQLNFASSQINNFKIEEKFTTIDRAKKISDSLQIPILITNKYVFSIGEICYKRLLEGYINDRKKGVETNNREKEGDINDRENDGDINERKTGGNVAERNKKGKKNNRDNGGDINDRDNGGDNNNRNSDGSIGNEPHCSNTKNGKIILYTRQEIDPKTSTIYFKNQSFNNKYFKIQKL